jgi:hypothetical protein
LRTQRYWFDPTPAPYFYFSYNTLLATLT